MVNEPPILLFDGSFEGWLTVVFIIYENHWQHSPIITITTENEFIPSLWQTYQIITTDLDKAERVSRKIETVFDNQGMRQLLWGFLSEQPQVYRHLFNIVRYQLSSPTVNVWEDITQADVSAVDKLIKMVGRERHRVKAFVRFEHTEQDVYFARIEPDFNVLPLIESHFKERYADQNWAIYDVKRGYGLFYDKQSETVQMIVDVDEQALSNLESEHSENEKAYQKLWQKYFVKVTIKERINRKLHIHYLPKRYWKYLIEKQQTQVRIQR